MLQVAVDGPEEALAPPFKSTKLPLSDYSSLVSAPSDFPLCLPHLLLSTWWLPWVILDNPQSSPYFKVPNFNHICSLLCCEKWDSHGFQGLGHGHFGDATILPTTTTKCKWIDFLRSSPKHWLWFIQSPNTSHRNKQCHLRKFIHDVQSCSLSWGLMEKVIWGKR